ncbi:MAG TPA: twin-arginine translocase TatA/TatE family subunit [Ktedonosporobacter sp.]|nr:twin-arginine translocase TatA/TatE family subunit [Ktedonosporobacter sp.]
MPIGFHPVELIIILVIALLVFGPKKLPEMGSAIGKSIKEFQKGMKELTSGGHEDDDIKTSSAVSLEAIEREIAAKKAEAEAIERDLEAKRAAAREAAQPEVSADAPETAAHSETEVHSEEHVG